MSVVLETNNSCKWIRFVSKLIGDVSIITAAQVINGLYGKQALRIWRVSTSFQKLKGVLPNKLTALDDWVKLVAMSNAYVDDPSTTNRLAGLLAPLTTEEAGRMRYVRGYRPSGRKYVKNLGVRWGTAIDLFLRLMPKHIRVEVIGVLETLMLDELTDSEDVNSVLKQMSIVMKKHGTLISKHWKWYVSWDTFGGYAPSLSIEEQIDAVRFWVSGNVEHKYLGSEKIFLEKFEKYIKEFLWMAPSVAKANEEAVTISEWVKEPVNWARQGTSSHASQLTFRGGTKKTRKSKWSTALGKSNEFIESLVRDKITTMSSVAIQKREPSKVRAIITSDDRTYLKMSYISHWLETALYGHPKTTLFHTPMQNFQLWERMANDCKREEPKVPIDQVQFDHQPNRKMDAAAFRQTREFISVHAVEPVRTDLLKTMDTITVAMLNKHRTVTVKGNRGTTEIPSQKGLESGLRWTALIGTEYNYAELKTAVDMVIQFGISDPVIDETVQGDDDRIRARTIAAASGLVGAYKNMNFSLNLNKFFVDFTRDEFLRQVAEPDEVSGYPARGVLALLWRNPVSKDPIAGLLRIREQVKSWNLMIGRGADKKSVLLHMYKDVTAANGITKEELTTILRTPASVGGLGFYPHKGENKGLKIDAGVKNNLETLDVNSVSGLDWNIDRLRDMGMHISKEEAVAFISNNVEMVGVKVDVTKGEVNIVDIPKPVTWTASGGKVPMVPRVSKEIPKTLGMLALSKAVRDKRWSWIQDVYVDVRDRPISTRIHRRGGRATWIAWLKGSLPFSMPIVQGWSDAAVSIFYLPLAQAYWSRVANYYKFNLYGVRRAAVAMEEELRVMMLNRIIHIGG